MPLASIYHRTPSPPTIVPITRKCYQHVILNTLCEVFCWHSISRNEISASQAQPHYYILKSIRFVESRRQQNILTVTGVFVLFPPVHTFSFKSAYFLLRFPLSSPLANVWKRWRKQQYVTPLRRLFKSLRLHLCTLKTKRCQNDAPTFNTLRLH